MMVETFLPARAGSICRGIVEQGVLHPHGGAGVVFIFDFGFGERGFIVHAPVDGAQAFIDESVFVEGKERGEHDRLVLRIHGGVGAIEAAEYADALELGALQVEKFLGVLAAFGADVAGLHLQLFAAQFFVDFDFDGQAVAIPAGDVGGVESSHGLGLDDEILEAFVHGGAHVDGATGVGRAVVQDEAGRAFAGLADALVDAGLLPVLEHFGLVLGQVGLHGEGGFGQIDGGFQFKRHSGASSQMIESFHYREERRGRLFRGNNQRR